MIKKPKKPKDMEQMAKRRRQRKKEGKERIVIEEREAQEKYLIGRIKQMHDNVPKSQMTTTAKELLVNAVEAEREATQKQINRALEKHGKVSSQDPIWAAAKALGITTNKKPEQVAEELGKKEVKLVSPSGRKLLYTGPLIEALIIDEYINFRLRGLICRRELHRDKKITHPIIREENSQRIIKLERRVISGMKIMLNHYIFEDWFDEYSNSHS